ncbi:DUF3501 family protein [Variovorax paradoxus]|nr:DUF3501 family protein [Variovorax paradoxus]
MRPLLHDQVSLRAAASVERGLPAHHAARQSHQVQKRRGQRRREDETTIRRQIQEMLHVEKIFDEEGIQSEIDVYAALVPDGSNWKATMLIEFPDVHERKRELARLIGVEDRMFVEVEGHERIYAIADEDMERENDEKTSAVHFVRFEFGEAARAAVRAGASVKLGCDHTHYPALASIAPETLASLAGDLKD